MISQDQLNYERIAEAITYIRDHFREQPTLNEIAAQVHLSPAHFQRLFTDWAGTSPKKLIQYLSIGYAKSALRQRHFASIADAVYDTGLSSTSRLHELFVHIEGMTPAEYRDGGRHLGITYDFADTPFGRVIIAATSKGICHIAFEPDEAAALQQLTQQFPNATFRLAGSPWHTQALTVLSNYCAPPEQIKLHLKGSPFQLKVWESLLKIPTGGLCTYGDIAGHIGRPGAARAVGSAIGSNPVAFLIPCHRVIQSSGMLGGYMWHPARKAAIIAWEGAKCAADAG